MIAQFILVAAIVVSGVAGALPSTVLFGQVAPFSGGEIKAGERLRAGVLAAFKEVNDKGGVQGTTTLSLVTADDGYDKLQTPVVAAALYAANPSITALIGGYGSPTTAALLDFLETSGLTTVGPLTGSSVFRKTFRDKVVNVRAGYDDEVYAMLNVLINSLNIRRVGMFYQDDAYGEPAMRAFVAALPFFGLTTTGTVPYSIQWDITQFSFANAVATLLANKPGAIIIYGASLWVPSLIAELVKESPKIVCITGSFGVSMLTTTLKTLGTDPSGIYVAQTFPHPMDTTKALVRSYRAAISAYEGAATEYDYISLEGYASARTAIAILEHAHNASKEEFLDTIYRSVMFTIDDYIIGPMERDCRDSSPREFGRSSLCMCSQGFRSVELSKVDSNYQYSARPDTRVDFSLADCYGTPEGVLVVKSQFMQLVGAASNQQKAGAALAAGVNLAKVLKLTVLHQSFNTQVEAASSEEQALSFYNLTGLLLPVGYSSNRSLGVVFNPFLVPQQLSEDFIRSHVFLTASLEQEMFAAAHYVRVASFEFKTIHLLASGAVDRYDQLQEVFARTVLTHGLAKGSVVHTTGLLSEEASIDRFGNTGNIIVVGMTTGSEFRKVATLLTLHLNLRAFFPFTDVAAIWEEVLQCSSEPPWEPLCGNGILARMYFMTNLPPWRNVTAAVGNSIAVEFFAARGDQGETAHPLEMLGFYTAKALKFVIGRVAVPSSEEWLGTWYRAGVISVGDEERIGPFNDIPCSGSNCLCNQGARKVSVTSLLAPIKGIDVKDTSEDATTYFPTCNIIYATAPVETSSTGIVLAIVIPIVVVALIAVFGSGLFWYRSWIRVVYAPKNPDAPCYIAFISLKDETLLWEKYPTEMPKAFETLKDIVKSATRRNKCYEVKMIGCSFMVAAERSQSILAMAAEVQQRVSETQWGKALRGQSTDDRVSTGTGISHHVSREHSHVSHATPVSQHSSHNSSTNKSRHSAHNAATTIAVGIGINGGHVRINHSEETGSYDYQGVTVSRSAVVADVAQGGQILVTQSLSGRDNANASRMSAFMDKTIDATEVSLFQYNPPGLPVLFFEPPTSNGDDCNYDSVAAALEQQSSGIAPRTATVLALKFEFLDTPPPDEKPLKKHSDEVAEVLKQVSAVAAKNKGEVESVASGTIFISFNVAGRTPHQATRAYSASLEIQMLAPCGKVWCGIASGKALVGPFKVGSEVRTIALSHVHSTAVALIRYAAMAQFEGVSVMTTDALLDELAVCADFQAVDVVPHAPRWGTKPQMLVALMGPKSTGEANEWMYELEEHGDNKFYALNTAVQSLLEGDQNRAHNVLEALQAELDGEGVEEGRGAKGVGACGMVFAMKLLELRGDVKKFAEMPREKTLWVM